MKKVANASGNIAEVVLSCQDLDHTLTFYIDELGFEVESIIPADNPKIAVISGYGLRLRLEIGVAMGAARFRILCDKPDAEFGGKRLLVAPNGVEFEVVGRVAPVVIPPHRHELVVTKCNEDSTWVTGRVGMRYRDLVPARLGGRYGASHIHVVEGGPLKDYVHYHRVQFQMIYCYKGWASLVYEDQGEPFLMNAGDCVLQPPEIRHRVLECSDDLHVIELSCPAGHETHADKHLDLPNGTINPERVFSGQVFVHHVADTAIWGESDNASFLTRDLEIGRGTAGACHSSVLKSDGAKSMSPDSHDCDFYFIFILQGQMTLAVDGVDDEVLGAGDSFVLPPSVEFCFSEVAPDTELLHVAIRSVDET